MGKGNEDRGGFVGVLLIDEVDYGDDADGKEKRKGIGRREEEGGREGKEAPLVYWRASSLSLDKCKRIASRYQV